MKNELRRGVWVRPRTNTRVELIRCYTGPGRGLRQGPGRERPRAIRDWSGMADHAPALGLDCIFHRWLQALEKGHNITAVFRILDFKKAFDRVWHHGLLHKLLTCGISPKSVTWISSYLTNRQISVKVRNTFSEFHPITRSVPQGSHLGPILFIVFINDLIPSVAIPTEVYADDTTPHQQHQKTPNLTASPTWNYRMPLLVPRNGHSSGTVNLATPKQSF